MFIASDNLHGDKIWVPPTVSELICLPSLKVQKKQMLDPSAYMGIDLGRIDHQEDKNESQTLIGITLRKFPI